VAEKIEALRIAIHDLAGVDPAALADPETIIELASLSPVFECIMTKAVGEFDTWGEWALDGAKTVVAWLETRCHLPKGEARALARRAQALPHLPLAAEAFADGEIGAAQFDALAQKRTPVNEEAMARDEAMLVGFAKDMKFAAFCRALAHWAQMADPDGAEGSEFERQARRDVYLSPTINGMFLGGMTLDAFSGSIVSAELKRLEDALFATDWAEATERLGRAPKLHELARTTAQRRTDALVEMAERSRAMPADARRPEPLITILVGYEAMYGQICRIQGGPVVTPGSVLKHLDGATFERIVFAPGKRIECSVKSRFFVGATRRVIEVRDQECTHEYCDLPAEYCQIDHIIPWVDGGLTEQKNGKVLCGFHNRLRNYGPPESGGHGPEPGP
jgi:hypothetical protein